MGLETLIIGGMIAGTAVQAYAQRKQYKAEKALYDYNADVAKREARQIRKASMEEQHERRDQARRLLAQRRALYAKAGVTMSGSPFLAQLDVASQESDDIARLVAEYELSAQRQLSIAKAEKMRGRTAVEAGRLEMMGTLFGGAAQTGFMKYRMNQLEA